MRPADDFALLDMISPRSPAIRSSFGTYARARQRRERNELAAVSRDCGYVGILRCDRTGGPRTIGRPPRTGLGLIELDCMSIRVLSCLGESPSARTLPGRAPAETHLSTDQTVWNFLMVLCRHSFLVFSTHIHTQPLYCT